jgi:hypothetical protein
LPSGKKIKKKEIKKLRSQIQPTKNDREDARKALAVYQQVRIEKGVKPLEIILQLWGTEHWTDASKELFLSAIRQRQSCDERSKFLGYRFDAIQEWHRTRIQYSKRTRDVEDHE